MSATRQDKNKQIKYMLDNKQAYLNNGTSPEEFKRRLDLLKK